MIASRSRSIAALLGLVACALLSAAPARAVDPFHAYLHPDTIRIVPGERVDVPFMVDSTARHFNGYQITMLFDPDVVTFVTEAEGPLMVDRCPERFTRVAMTDSTVTYAHVLLCEGLSLDGPGTLSVYTFQAQTVGTTNVRIVSDPDESFCDEGLYVCPEHPTYPRQVEFHDTVIMVLDPASDVPESRPANLAAPWPNPFRERTSIAFDLPAARGVDLSVFDCRGRRVRSLVAAELGEGRHVASWDGRDQTGRRAASGTYFYVMRSGALSVAKEVILLK